jgi:acid phosphatase (class A)
MTAFKPIAVVGALLLSVIASAAAADPIDDEIRYSGWTRSTLALLDRQPYFLGRAELLALELPPPPANSSDSTRRDLEALLQLQQRARTRDALRAIAAHREYPGVCAAVLATVYRELTHAPKTRALLEHVERDATVAVFNAKRRFERARPHQLDARIKPAMAVPAHSAYPSGHALQGYLVARVLSAIFPDYREELMRAGDQIGYEREIAGFHYASDSAASRALGAELYARLEANERFQRELAAARSEWQCQGP